MATPPGQPPPLPSALASQQGHGARVSVISAPQPLSAPAAGAAGGAPATVAAQAGPMEVDHAATAALRLLLATAPPKGPTAAAKAATAATRKAAHVAQKLKSSAEAAKAAAAISAAQNATMLLVFERMATAWHASAAPAPAPTPPAQAPPRTSPPPAEWTTQGKPKKKQLQNDRAAAAVPAASGAVARKAAPAAPAPAPKPAAAAATPESPSPAVGAATDAVPSPGRLKRTRVANDEKSTRGVNAVAAISTASIGGAVSPATSAEASVAAIAQRRAPDNDPLALNASLRFNVYENATDMIIAACDVEGLGFRLLSSLRPDEPTCLAGPGDHPRLFPLHRDTATSFSSFARRRRGTWRSWTRHSMAPRGRRV